MLVVERNTTFVTWSIGNDVHPIDYSGEVVVVFDPSKSNMAMVIGTPDGTILNILEFSGNNRKRGPVMDTTIYCEEVRQFLKQYLQKVDLYFVGVEQAITKKGMEHHHSNMVLTEIRSNILNFFLDQYNIRVTEINNWSWKFGVLPEGCRSKYEKGSKKYFRLYEPESPYNNYFEADVTDCVCIFRYVIKTFCKNFKVYCNRFETCISDYKYAIYPASSTIINKLPSFVYNPIFSVQENLNYYVNRLLLPFVLEVPTTAISIEDIYGKASYFTKSDLTASTCKLVVARC